MGGTGRTTVYNPRILSICSEALIVMGRSDGAATSLSDPASSGLPVATPPTPAQLRALWLPMVLFVLISVADTASSVHMLLTGMMDEYNPLMRWVWVTGGVPAFIGVKAFLTIVPVWLFNRLKRERYSLVRRAVWVTVFGYATIYGGLFCIANY
ncbi:MAG: hypothetical protein FJX74_06940 [Armatimonadetes bacterium]|nr:hypothetical protein [Armatimonadota bacterium]